MGAGGEGAIFLASHLAWKFLEDVASNQLKAKEIGIASFESFVNSTLKTQSLSFHKPLKRNKLKTFTFLSKVVSVKPSGLKEIKMKNQRNIGLMHLVNYLFSHKPITLASRRFWPIHLALCHGQWPPQMVCLQKWPSLLSFISWKINTLPICKMN